MLVFIYTCTRVKKMENSRACIYRLSYNTEIFGNLTIPISSPQGKSFHVSIFLSPARSASIMTFQKSAFFQLASSSNDNTTFEVCKVRGVGSAAM